MTDAAYNERVKLTATYISSFAVGLLVTGGIAPALAALYGVPGLNVPAGTVAMGSIACLAISITLHFTARAFLRSMR